MSSKSKIVNIIQLTTKNSKNAKRKEEKTPQDGYSQAQKTFA
jgi:hypothetical protein